MRTMYLAEIYKYTDCEGRYGKYFPQGDFVETIDEAKEKVKDVKKSFPIEGSWRIIKKTIDEASFSVEVETVEEFDYYKEVAQFEWAEQQVEMYTEMLEEEKAHLLRCKTERSTKSAKKEIERIEKNIKYYKGVLTERK